MNCVTPIAQLGAEVLRLQASRIDDFTCAKFHSLIETMQQLMLQENGVGIAAPQLGESFQILIIASRPTPRYPQAPAMAPIVMVNPEVRVTDDTLVKDWEGCLSIPGIRALVPRANAVYVSYQNPNGDHYKLDLQGFPARVFQHEYDHLIGKVYLDRVENNRDIVSESEFFKLLAA